MTTSTTTPRSSSDYSDAHYVLSIHPVTGELQYAHYGAWLTKESAVKFASDKDSELAWLEFTHAVYSTKELQALIDSGVRIKL